MLQWSQECGHDTHFSLDAPVVTFGGAAGFLNPGRFIDSRNRSAQISQNQCIKRPGLTYRQWLATAMQSMGMEPGEFEDPGVAGYGETFMAQDWNYGGAVHPNVINRASDIVPLIGN